MADGFSFDDARTPAGFSFEDAQKPVPFSFDDARGGDLPDSTEPTPYRRGYRNAPPALIDTPAPARPPAAPMPSVDDYGRIIPDISAPEAAPAPPPQRDPRHPADWYPSQPTARQDGLAGTALGKIGQAAREGWQNSPATSPEWQYILDKSGWGGITRLLDSGMAVSNAAMRAAQETAVQIGTEIGMPRAGREVAGFMEYWMTGQGIPHAPEVPGFREGASEAARNYAEAKAGDVALKDIAAGQPGTPAAAAPMPTLERMAAEARAPRTPEQAATEEMAPGAAEPAAPEAPTPAPEPPQTAPEPEVPPPPRELAPVTPEPAAPFSFEEASTPPESPEAPASRATPWTPVPREPKRLIPYLRESTVQFPGTPHENVIPGGLQDMGGDLSAIIGGPRGRPGLINAAGRTLDDATLHAWEAGYMPEFSERPAINDLLEAIRDDHTGIARYSHYDFDDAQAYRDARAHNEEIGRLADQYGIPLKGITRDQFFDRVADHASLEDVAREAAEQSVAHEAEYAAAERAAKEWTATHEMPSDAESIYGQSQARTLEELENADRQEAAATAAQQRAPGDGEPEPAPVGAGPVQEGGGPRGGGAGAGRGDAATARGASPPRHEQILAELDARNAPDADYRAAFSTGTKTPLRAGETWRQRLVDWIASERREPPTTDLLGRPTPPPATRPAPEPTIRNDARQTGLPGTEPSAVQAQAARDAGRGTLTGSATQKPADEGLFAPDTSGQGKLLAQRQNETPEFRRWFGDSKVVDADGKPLVVYHGTTGDFDTFSNRMRGSATQSPEGHQAFFFTDRPEVAGDFTPTVREDDLARTTKAPGSNIMPVFLRLENPAEWDWGRGVGNSEDLVRAIREAKREGHDGLIIRDIRDNGFQGGQGRMSDHYIAFHPTQIKSAIGNRGTFDPTNPSVLYSFPAALFDPDAYRRIGGALAPHAAAAKAATMRLAESIATLFVPMRTGTVRSQAFAGTFANSLRQIMYRFGEIDREIERNFTPRQRDQMGRALDAQSVFEQGLRDRPAAEHDAARAEFDAGGTGLASLNPAQRRAVEMLDKLSQDAWRQMQERGMVDPNAAPLPYYFPRQLVRWSEENGFSRASSEGGAGRGIDARGQNLTTSGPMRREHLTPEETEAAARAKLGADVHLLRDIRSLPQRLAFTHRAIAGVDLMNQIEHVGRDTGVDLVVKGDIPGLLNPADYFTMADHPSFRRWTGTGWQALHVSKEFEGPLRAVLTQRSPLLYQAAQRLKGGVMSAIMYSPFIHLAVELGRSLPVMPGRILTLRALRDGSTLRRDLGYMDQATRDGLAPLGQGWHADPVSIADAAIVDSKTGFLAALGNARDAVANGAGRVGGQFLHDVVQHPHQTLLWDQVFNLQVGIYDEMRRRYIAKGFDPDVAGTMAAHIANRYAGALPSEHLSRGANMAANLLLFSRSFTLGNLGVMKDMFNGAPSHVRARIEQMAGPEVAKSAQSALRRKAISAVAMDIGLFYMANGLLQAGLQVLRNAPSQGLPAAAQQTYQQWLDEAGQAMSNARSNPLEAFGVLPQHWNEPGKQDRVFAGTDSKGRGVYLRLPPGKVGEEFLGWFAKPGVLLLNKSSPLVRPIIESIIGHDSLGRQIYKPDPQTIGDALSIAGAVVKHIGEGMGPTSTIQGLHEIWQQQVQGVPTTSDPYVSAAKVLGPLTGLAQVSSGFPGGPAAGEIHAQSERQRYDQQKAMPAIRSKIAAGDTDGAVSDMVALGMRQGEIRYYLRQTLAPGVTAGAMKRLQSMPPGTQDRVQRHLAP